jgi:hypothetical protein
MDPQNFMEGLAFEGSVELEASNLSIRRKACSELLSAIASKPKQRQNRASHLKGFGMLLGGNRQNGVRETADFPIGIFYQNLSRFVA